jgi:hypothetical protein
MLTSLLDRFLGTDNAQRSFAEKEYQEYKASYPYEVDTDECHMYII